MMIMLLSWEKFLSKTLVAIDDGQWSCQLVVEATRYLPTYNHSLEEKVCINKVKLLNSDYMLRFMYYEWIVQSQFWSALLKIFTRCFQQSLGSFNLIRSIPSLELPV